MKFFKKNSYDIVKLYINQIGIMIFSLVLYTAVGMIENQSTFNKLSITVSVFSLLFYCFLVYTVLWDIGSKDKIRIDGGRMELDRFKGLKASLFANIPNLILAGGSVIFTSLFLLTGSSGLEATAGVFFVILKVHCSMLMGFVMGVTPTPAVTDPTYSVDCLVESALYLIIPVISVAVCQLGYSLGVKEKRIFGSSSKNKKK